MHIVVEVVSLPGQTEITVVNQANASGDPLDENGNPRRDDSGALIARVTDDSDSGTDATGSNPGAPGNAGSWDDPTPQKLTFFTFDSYNDFSQGRKSQQLFENRDPSDPFDGAIQRIDRAHRILPHEIQRLAPEPIFSGSARPGTQVIGRVFDSAGRLIGEELSFADVGGNWMMQFRSLQSPDHGRFEFVEIAGNSNTFDSRGDVYGYLGSDSLNNDYASLEPWTSYDRSYEFAANYRPTVPQSLMQKHQQNTKPIGFGR